MTESTNNKWTIISAAKMNAGDTFKGTFGGVRELQYGPGYEIVNEEGKSTILAGAKRLGYALEKIEVGTDVLVTYTGKSKVTIKTGKYAGKTIDAHGFEVNKLN